ncbi:MAG TPA: hypothetical protein VK203_12140 [Nostocaceae cyanobacterium]|nr:hypothetical protein [Nostocaceae cyanobacterium]
MKKRFLFCRLFLLALVTVLIISCILEQAPDFPCSQWGFIKTQNPKYYIHPERVVIQPWLGQHHVYGVFMLPSGYAHDRLMTVRIPENEPFCGTVLNAGQSADGVNAQPGHYLARGYLRTRTTLKLVIQGKIQHLLNRKNWQIGSAGRRTEETRGRGDAGTRRKKDK